jgi:hypothetical protein
MPENIYIFLYTRAKKNGFFPVSSDSNVKFFGRNKKESLILVSSVKFLEIMRRKSGDSLTVNKNKLNLNPVDIRQAEKVKYSVG